MTNQQENLPGGMGGQCALILVFFLFAVISFAGIIGFLGSAIYSFDRYVPAKESLVAREGTFQSGYVTGSGKSSRQYHLIMTTPDGTMTFCQFGWSDLVTRMSPAKPGDKLQLLLKSASNQCGLSDIWEINDNGEMLVSYEDFKMWKSSNANNMARFSLVSATVAMIGISICFFLNRFIKKQNQLNS